jgi:hypothetical protein
LDVEAEDDVAGLGQSVRDLAVAVLGAGATGEQDDRRQAACCGPGHGQVAMQPGAVAVGDGDVLLRSSLWCPTGEERVHLRLALRVLAPVRVLQLRQAWGRQRMALRVLRIRRLIGGRCCARTSNPASVCGEGGSASAAGRRRRR